MSKLKIHEITLICYEFVRNFNSLIDKRNLRFIHFNIYEGGVSSSCSTFDTRLVTLLTKPGDKS